MILPAPASAADRRIADLLAAEINTLAPAERNDALLIARAKSRIAHRIRMERAGAMREAAGVAQGRLPAWMLSAHPFVTEWLRWTSRLNKIIAAAEPIQMQPLPSGRIEVHRTASGRTMTLRGGIYMGTLTGAIELSRQPVARYVDEPTPRIIFDRSALPDTILASIVEREDRSNCDWRLGDIIDHPFVAAYGPPITSVANVDGAVEIALEPGYTTLAPVPVAAMRVTPRDADPGRPWELTPPEREWLRGWTPATAATGR